VTAELAAQSLAMAVADSMAAPAVMPAGTAAARDRAATRQRIALNSATAELADAPVDSVLAGPAAMEPSGATVVAAESVASCVAPVAPVAMVAMH